MPKIEIDEEEFRASQTLRQTVNKMLANPEAAVLAEKALKLVEPNARTPRLDAANAQNAPLEETQKQLKALEKQIADSDAKRDRDAKLNHLNASIEAGKAQLRQQGWTEEGIKGVEKIMEEKGLIDPLDAAVLFEKAHPPQNPIAQSGSGAWNFTEFQAGDGDADLKKLVESKGANEPLVDKMARDALTDIRSSRR